MSLELDNKDISILGALLENSRMSLTELAQKLNVSIPTIKSRMEKLESLGIIEGFSLNIAIGQLTDAPFFYVIARILSDSFKEVSKKIGGYGEVKEVHEILGESSLMIVTHHLSVSEFHSFLNGLREIKGVIEVSSWPVMATSKRDHLRLPRSVTLKVHLKCQYCSKRMAAGEDYQSTIIDDVTHYFCCKTCQATYLSERKNNVVESPDE